ncbi:hypothetical protein DXD28_06820 [Bifidobacterium longum]|nr:hypothetical protein DXD28_06820 [Bifidobacterium longum]
MDEYSIHVYCGVWLRIAGNQCQIRLNGVGAGGAMMRMPTKQSLRGLNTSVKMDFRCQKLGLKMIRIR